MARLGQRPYHRDVRLTRAIWALLVVALVAAIGTTWWLTRPEAPEPPWVGAVGVLAGEARFSEPFGLAVAPDGTVLVSDAGQSHRIRRIAADGAVTTLAGGGRGFTDGRGAEARFATPSAIALAPDGSLVVADTGNHAIRRVAPDGTVTTIAGDGTSGYVDGPAAQARFNAPVGVAVDASGRVIVADTYNDRIRVIDPDGQVRTLAGSRPRRALRHAVRRRRSMRADASSSRTRATASSARLPPMGASPRSCPPSSGSSGPWPWRWTRAATCTWPTRAGRSR